MFRPPIIGGHNNRHPRAALAAVRDGDKPGVGEGFERSALGAALNAPATQMKIGPPIFRTIRTLRRGAAPIRWARPRAANPSLGETHVLKFIAIQQGDQLSACEAMAFRDA